MGLVNFVLVEMGDTLKSRWTGSFKSMRKEFDTQDLGSQFDQVRGEKRVLKVQVNIEFQLGEVDKQMVSGKMCVTWSGSTFSYCSSYFITNPPSTLAAP